MKRILLLITLASCLLAFAADRESSKWLSSLADAQSQSAKKKKPILVDFYASWCGPCRLMERDVFQNKAVAAFLTNDVISLRVDLSVDGLTSEVVKTNKSLAEHYNVVGFPCVLLLDSSGKEIARITPNLRDPAAFLAAVRERMPNTSRK